MKKGEEIVLIAKQFCDNNKVVIYYPNAGLKFVSKGAKVLLNSEKVSREQLGVIVLNFAEKNGFELTKAKQIEHLTKQVISESIGRQIENGSGVQVL